MWISSALEPLHNMGMFLIIFIFLSLLQAKVEALKNENKSVENQIQQMESQLDFLKGIFFTKIINCTYTCCSRLNSQQYLF
jgi:hypothetical protein